MSFEDWKATLPPDMKRGDMKRARARYERIVAAGHEKRLGRALKRYLDEQRHYKWRSWLYLPSFLGRWEEFLGFLDEERCETLFDEEDPYLVKMREDKEKCYAEAMAELQELEARRK